MIPTCVDLDRFPPAPLPDGPPRLLLAGTLNGYYDLPLMARFADVARRRSGALLRVLSPPATPIDPVLGLAGVQRGSADPSEMPLQVAASSAGLSVCRADAGVSLTAAMPTKIAEFLSVGRPVVVNVGLGDADALLRSARAGVVLDDVTDDGLERAWSELSDLLSDPMTPARCRTLAEKHFSLARGVDLLLATYKTLSAT